MGVDRRQKRMERTTFVIFAVWLDGKNDARMDEFDVFISILGNFTFPAQQWWRLSISFTFFGQASSHFQWVRKLLDCIDFDPVHDDHFQILLRRWKNIFRTVFEKEWWWSYIEKHWEGEGSITRLPSPIRIVWWFSPHRMSSSLFKVSNFFPGNSRRLWRFYSRNCKF